MRCIVQTPEIVIYNGRAEQWEGCEHVDMVFTNPYGSLPESLKDHPMVIHQWVHRLREAELWSWNKLHHCVGTWNDDREAFWSAHYPRRTVDISMYRPEPGGWYPIGMVRKLLPQFVQKGQTVWDGFMGRGTVGKVCREMGVKYIGVEELSHHVALALNYLEILT